MHPKFSSQTQEKPLHTEGPPVMPEWSDDPSKPKEEPAKDPREAPRKRVTPRAEPKTKPVRKRPAPKELQADATQVNTVTAAQQWLMEHPEEAEMLRQAQVSSSGDILADAGLTTRWYSSAEAAAFFDKTVQWLYWGMRPPPNGGRLFTERLKDTQGNDVLDDDGHPVLVDIPVERLGDPETGKRRFDIPTIRRFAISAYLAANIKEPKLRAVLERLMIAERGGNWKSIPIPSRGEPKGETSTSSESP